MSRRISPPHGYRLPERASTGGPYPPNSYDPYGTRSRDRYTSPRTSGDRVGGGTTTLASVERYDAYGRKVSTSGAQPYSNPRSSNSSVSGAPARRPSVTAPPPRGYDSYNRPSVNQTASSRAPEPYARAPYNPVPAANSARSSHRQSSSIDDVLRGSASTRRDAGAEQQRARRDSNDRYQRDSRGYHTVGPKPGARPEDRGYEYGSSRDRYANSGAPRRSERSASIDTGSRERPQSMMIEYPGYDKPPRDAGPPPTTRGLRGVDRMNGGIGRSSSVRDQQIRSPVRAADRDRRGSSSEREHDDYYVPPRRRRPQSEYDQRPAMAPPPRQRMNDHRDSRPALRLEDTDIDKRGFGLRSPSPEATEQGFDQSRMIPAGTIEQRGRGPSPSAPAYGRPVAPRESQEDHDRRATDRKRDRVEDRSSAYDEPSGPPPNRSTRPDRSGRDRRSDAQSGTSPYHHPNTDISKTLDADHGPAAATAATAAGGGVAALAAGEHARRHDRSEDSDEGRKKERKEPRYDEEDQRPAAQSLEKESTSTRGHANRGAPRRSSDEISERSAVGDEEDDYELRLRQEMQRKAQARAGTGAPAGPPPASRQQPPARDDYSPPRAPRERPNDDKDLVKYGGRGRDDSPKDDDGGQALSRYQPPEVENYTQDKLSAEPEDPSERPTSPTTTTSSSKRVAIVEPPAEVLKPKGILKKPKDSWPVHPPEPRPTATLPKGTSVEGAPEGASSTKMSIDNVSTRVLDHYGERYVLCEGPNGEEMVEILRVLDMDTAVKYRNRTNTLRSGRDPWAGDKKRDEDEDDDEDENKRHRRHRRRRKSSHRDNTDDREDDHDER